MASVIEGGSRPVWSTKGDELFFLDRESHVVAVPVQKGAAFTWGQPHTIIATTYFSGATGRAYDVSHDGKRFLMVKERSGDGATTPNSIVVVMNWIEDLKRREEPAK